MKRNQKIRYTFTKRLLIGMLLLTLVPVLIFSVFTYFFTENLSMESVEKQSKSDLSGAVSQFDSLIQGYLSAFNTLKTDEGFLSFLDNPDNDPATKSRVYEKLYLIMGDHRSEISMFVMTEDLSFVVSTTEMPSQYNPVKYKRWGIFRNIEQNDGKPVVFPNVYINSFGEKIVMSIAVSLEGKNKNGYVIMDIPENMLSNILQYSNTGYNNYHHLVTSDNGLLLFNNAVANPRHNFISEEMNGIINANKKSTYSSDGHDFYVAREKAQSCDISFYSLQSLDLIDGVNRDVYNMAATVVVFSAVLSVTAGYLFTRSMTKPIKQIVKTVESIEKGNTNERIEMQRRDEFGFVADKFDETLDKLNHHHQLDFERQDRLRLAEIRSLQAQINPHFLYNTLDSVKWLAKLNDVPEISTIITELGRLLKSSMQTDTTDTTIEESIRLIESYIGIELIRHENKFTYEINVEDDLWRYKIPKLLLQPLVENAIVHGMENSLKKVHIRISVYRKNEEILLIVEDNGVGMQVDFKTLSGEEIALKNIDRRIKLYYGEQYGLSIKGEKGRGTTAIIHLPDEKESL